jgi:hypothetical protein
VLLIHLNILKQSQLPISVSNRNVAGLGGRAVLGMNCLRSLDSEERGFGSHAKDGCLCMRLFCVRVVLCLAIGFATG